MIQSPVRPSVAESTQPRVCSSMMMVIGGLENATHGDVRVAGQDLTGMNEDELALFRRERRGMVLTDAGAALVNDAIASGALFEKPAWQEVAGNCVRNGSTLHLVGLFSDGNVHSHIDQLKALIERARNDGVPRVRVHVLLDGRDVPECSAERYVAELEDQIGAETQDLRGLLQEQGEELSALARRAERHRGEGDAHDQDGLQHEVGSHVDHATARLHAGRRAAALASWAASSRARAGRWTSTCCSTSATTSAPACAGRRR